jgi:pimeloyl-ACP methyl ester carboxylesterase
VASWAAAHPERVAGLAGIYPVFDLRSYPGLASAAAAYQLSSEELEARLATLNPIAQIQALVTAQIPSFLIHGDTDTVVPIGPNSLAFREVYTKGKASALFQLEILPGQGHNMFNGFFQSLPLVEFAIAQAREGARH